MQRKRHPWPVSFMALAALGGAVATAQAQNAAVPADDPGERIGALSQQVTAQAAQIEVLRQMMAEQQARHADLKRELGLTQDPQTDAPGPSRQAADTGARPVRVGTAPAQESASPEVAPLFDQPGVLTPAGSYVLEPSVQYSYSSSNRVALVGYTIIPALLIGLVDVREVKRNTITGALALRYGLTNRFELEAKLPYVYRSDATISREIFTGSASPSVFSNSGRAIGDVEFGARYQINDGGPSTPYLIGALRFKARTGKDPFEVVTDCVTRCIGNTTGTGLPLDLPTGSGFYSLQSALTWLFPSDPAVFFGGFSYTHNFARSGLSRRVLNGEQEFVGTIAPGSVLGVNFGMGLALNERSSFSMGIDLNSIGRTRQNGVPLLGSVRTQLASLLLGYSYRYSNKTAFSLTVGAGLTRDTPDLTVNLRVPFTF